MTNFFGHNPLATARFSAVSVRRLSPPHVLLRPPLGHLQRVGEEREAFHLSRLRRHHLVRYEHGSPSVPDLVDVEADPDGGIVSTEGELAAGAHLNATRGDQWDFSKRKVSISRRSHICTSPQKVS
jgi:hypothetical protein